MADRGRQSESQTPALVAAARDGHLFLVMQLIKQGHSLNVYDKDGTTALYWACCRGHDKISQFLLDAGSDTTARVKWGATALLGATDNGQEKCVKQLLKKKVDVNTSNDRGDTPLHAAAYRGYVNILCLLLEAGANPFMKNSASMTPMQEAFAQRQHECVSRLQQYLHVVPGVSGPMSLSTPASFASTPRSLEESCKSWPCVPSSNIPRASPIALEEKGYSLHFLKKDTSFDSENDSSRLTNNTTSKLTGPDCSGLSQSSTDPDKNHKMEKIDPPKMWSFCENNPKNSLGMGNISFSELAAAKGKDARLGCDSLLTKSASIQTKEGCQVPINIYGRLMSSLSSGLNHVTERETYISRSIETIRKNDTQHKIHQHMPASQNLIHRGEIKSTSSNPIEKENKLPQSVVQNKQFPDLLNPGSAKRAFDEVLPGMNVGEFVLELQAQLVELQEKLSQSNALISQLTDKLLAEQQENANLKVENCNLRSLLYQQDPFSMRTRGGSESDHARCIPDLTQSLTYFTDMSTVTMGSRCAVESSEIESDPS